MRDPATPSAFTLVPNADGNIISDKTLAGGMPSIAVDNTNGNGNGQMALTDTPPPFQPVARQTVEVTTGRRPDADKK